MALGYDGKLYILAFDHRGSFQKKMFGIQGDPTDEETRRIADAKHLIYEGMVKAVGQGAEAGATGVLVDEQFGGDIPAEAKAAGLVLSMPVEKSGQEEFDFQYGDQFGEHIAEFDPDFSKVLVRYNPEGDAGMNARQTARLKRLADWLHDNDRKFLFELLVPATDAQLESVGGDGDRFDTELRPDLMIRTIAAFQEADVEVDIWKIEGVDDRGECERIVAQARAGGRDRGRLRGLRDRALDLVGRAEGVPRRLAGARARRRADRRELPAVREGLRGGRGPRARGLAALARASRAPL